MHRGYIKLWRKAIDSGLLGCPNANHLFMHLLLKARHVEGKAVMNGCIVPLATGQLLYGRKEWSKNTGLSEREIRTALSILENLEIVTIKATSKYSIITVINWSSYQNNETAIDHHVDQRPTSKRPASDQRPTTSKECIELKNGKNEENTSIPALTGYPPEFERFWKAYPKKASKKDALKAYQNAKSKPDIESLVAIVETQKTWHVWTKQNGQYIPNPSTWLNQEKWLDECELNMPTIQGQQQRPTAYTQAQKNTQNREDMAKMYLKMQEEKEANNGIYAIDS